MIHMENVVIYGETAFAERIYSYIRFEKSMNVLAFTNAKAFKEKFPKKNLYCMICVR